MEKNKDIEDVLNIITHQYENIIEKPVVFKFEVTDSSMIPAGKEIKEITIKPLFVGVVMKLQPLISTLMGNGLDEMLVNQERDFTEETPKLFEKHMDTVLDIITIAIHNKQNSPPKWFREMLKYNCTWKDLHIFLNAILFRMGHANFKESIILIKNGMSLNSEGGIIALSENMKKMKQALTEEKKQDLIPTV